VRAIGEGTEKFPGHCDIRRAAVNPGAVMPVWGRALPVLAGGEVPAVPTGENPPSGRCDASLGKIAVVIAQLAAGGILNIQAIGNSSRRWRNRAGSVGNEIAGQALGDRIASQGGGSDFREWSTKIRSVWAKFGASRGNLRRRAEFWRRERSFWAGPSFL
jgi:hypothetical protein